MRARWRSRRGRTYCWRAGGKEIARAQIEATGALVNPTLSLSTARETARIGAGISVPVPLFGQRSTAVAAARADSDAVILETDALRVDARWNATRAWLDPWEPSSARGCSQIAGPRTAGWRPSRGNVSPPARRRVWTGARERRSRAGQRRGRAASAGISAARPGCRSGWLRRGRKSRRRCRSRRASEHRGGRSCLRWRRLRGCRDPPGAGARRGSSGGGGRARAISSGDCGFQSSAPSSSGTGRSHADPATDVIGGAAFERRS